MPPNRNHSPPVDPFPPLRRAGSSSSSNTPSYASIAARSHQQRDDELEDIRRSERSRRVRELERQVSERHWAAEDVDRQDNLDELNMNAHVEPEPIDIDPSPPWRSRHRSTAQTEGEAGPSRSPAILGTPSGTTQSRTNAIANGARNPPRDRDEGVSTPPQIPSRPSNHSPPSPSPTRPARPDPTPSSATRLAPMFTLEELLRTQPPRPTDPSTSNTNNNSRPTGQTVRAVLNDRRRRREMAYNFPWGMQMERALPAGAGAGDLEGDVDAVLNMLEDTSDPLVIPFPIDDSSISGRSITRTANRPLDGSGSNPTDNANQTITSFLRRRRRNPAPAAGSSFQLAYDPEEVLPANYPHPDPEPDVEDENEDEYDSDEERWASRLRIHTFSDGGEREFDVDGPVQAHNPGRSSSNLHRGGNNRRRRSFLNRIGAPPDLRFPEEFQEERMDFPPPLRGRSDATGCEPTNKDTAEIVNPVVVRSAGVVRAREEEGKKSSSTSTTSSPIRKKRRTGSRAEKDELEISTRPNYLSYSTLPLDTPLPIEFIAPLPRSHLAVSTYKSATHPPRPLVTFVGCNPTRRDDDATALHTTTPIPVSCGIHYYEVEVINKGIEGFISVGWVKEGINLKRLVGWDKGSWGWHGDDGRSFEGSGRGENFSETWTTADTVGCGINFLTGKAFFTKNGKMMGHRFSNLSSGLHPAVGLRSVGESLAINFTGPFKFDIDSYVKSIKDDISLELDSTKVEEIPRLVDQVPSSSIYIDHSDTTGHHTTSNKDTKGSKSALAQALQKELKGIEDPSPAAPKRLSDPTEKATSAFVLDYLQHHGHSRALALLQNGMAKNRKLDSAAVKTTSTTALDESTYESKSSDRVELSDFESKHQALEWIHRIVASSFDKPLPSLLVEELSGKESLPITIKASLTIYEFLHLLHTSNVTEGDDTALEAVLEKGRTMRMEMSSWSDDGKALVEKAFGILGRPEELKEEFWVEKRRDWADELVKVLREINNLNQVSQLEQAIRQTHVVLRTLSEKAPKSGAAFVNLKDMLKI